VKIEQYTTREGFTALQDEWNNLLERSATDTPFSSWQWHHHWWNAYHPGELLILSIREDSGDLIGIGSFFVVEDEEGQRGLHFVGCEDVTDYLDVLIDRGQQEAVYAALADKLADMREEFDIIDLCNIPEESPTLSILAPALRDCGFQVATEVQDVCPIIELPQTFDEYIGSLDKRQRKDLQRKLRMAKGQADALNWYTVGEEHDLDAEIEKFLKLMASSHPEKAAFLEDEQHVTFFKSIVPAAADAGWLQLVFLEVSGEAVAAYVNFDYNNRIMVYNSGLNPDKATALSPGILLLAFTIGHAIEQGREVFDYLRGDEQYKYRMGGQDTKVFNLKAVYRS